MLKYYIIFILVICFLIGCQSQPEQQPDQKIRREIFIECLKTVPKGPTNVKYNDWSEIVDSCGDQAYFQSLK